MDHPEILWCMRLASKRPLPLASFQVERVPGMRKLSELSAGQNEFDDEVQEEISLGFVFHLPSGYYGVVEKVCDLGGENFRAVILFYKSIMLGLHEQSR